MNALIEKFVLMCTVCVYVSALIMIGSGLLVCPCAHRITKKLKSKKHDQVKRVELRRKPTNLSVDRNCFD